VSAIVRIRQRKPMISRHKRMVVTGCVLAWLAIMAVFVDSKWDRLILRHIERITGGYSKLAFPEAMQAFSRADDWSKWIRSPRLRNKVREMNSARRYFAEVNASKTNEAYIEYVHLHSLIVQGLQHENVDPLIIAGNMRYFAETNAYAYGERLMQYETKLDLVHSLIDRTLLKMEKKRKLESEPTAAASPPLDQ